MNKSYDQKTYHKTENRHKECQEGLKTLLSHTHNLRFGKDVIFL